MTPRTRVALLHLSASVAAVVAASAVASLLDPHASLAVLSMVYLTAVLVVSYWVSFAASAVAALLAVQALNFLFVEPRWTFTVHATDNLLTLAALLGVSLVVSTLSTRLRRAAEVAQERERRARDLQLLASELADLDELRLIVQAAQRSLGAAAQAPVTVALARGDNIDIHADPRLPAPPAGSVDHDGLQHCIREGEALGPGSGRWNELPNWYFPLRAGNQCLGALSLPAHPHAEDERDHARLVADLLAGALRRAHHAAAAAQARSESQIQQQRNALLAAVSHDFRTPLASIIGAVSALQAQREKLDERDRSQLLTLIEGEAQHLAAMTENTLQWARLSDPEPKLHADWESLEEIVGSVLKRVRQRDPLRRVKAEIPVHLPLVWADAVLLGQLLENLLDNALKYSEGSVQLTVQANDATLQVDVLDRGQGIAEEDLPRIFDAFYRSPKATGVRGAGIGLAVGRAIAEVHGGMLVAQRRPGGGSVLRLSLPLRVAPTAPDETAAA
jgi:two-component system sensor histidine kinase KdpD